MPRASAFGPTTGFKPPRRSGGGAGLLDRMTGGDDPEAFSLDRSSVPRPGGFTPAFPDLQETGSGQAEPDAGRGDNGNDMAPSTPLDFTKIKTVPLLSPSQENRRNVLDSLMSAKERALDKAEPSDAETAFTTAKTGVKSAGDAFRVTKTGEDLLSSILTDAGFTEGAIRDLLPTLGKLDLPNPFSDVAGLDLTGKGEVLDPAKFAGTLTEGAGAGANLSGLTDAAGGTLGSPGTLDLISSLGDFAQYLPYIGAGLGIGGIASGNKQDDQKALAAAGTLLSTLVSAGIPGVVGGVGSGIAAATSAAAEAAGLGAAGAGTAGSFAGAGFAAPLIMGLMFSISHFLDMMENVPHEVREQMDVAKRTPEAQQYLEGLGEVTDVDQLLRVLTNRSSPIAGGQGGGADRMIFNARFGDKFIGDPAHSRYPVASLEELLANPEKLEIIPQLGVLPGYTDPWKTKITNAARNRLALFSRAKQGDPAALESMALLKARVDTIQKNRAKRERDETDQRTRREREQILDRMLSAGGDSGGPGGGSPSGGGGAGTGGTGDG